MQVRLTCGTKMNVWVKILMVVACVLSLLLGRVDGACPPDAEECPGYKRKCDHGSDTDWILWLIQKLNAALWDVICK